ncbi:TPA: methyl-accepting chemotaxis protein [Vibrio vulnificus]|nr:hypothetical protein [Vibrio vulnificus]HAS6026705.1 hypothetical protein [Vibrio vulnificus]HAS6036190.1 hypothetical protein [Vibrio vulnificus]HAS6152763.1 hypothetical protein [Vibrio vulnificus]HAS6353694.1 hypothetical protein [Vibrio vulnificus]
MKIDLDLFLPALIALGLSFALNFFLYDTVSSVLNRGTEMAEGGHKTALAPSSVYNPAHRLTSEQEIDSIGQLAVVSMITIMLLTVAVVVFFAQRRRKCLDELNLLLRSVADGELATRCETHSLSEKISDAAALAGVTITVLGEKLTELNVLERKSLILATQLLSGLRGADESWHDNHADLKKVCVLFTEVTPILQRLGEFSQEVKEHAEGGKSSADKGVNIAKRVEKVSSELSQKLETVANGAKNLDELCKKVSRVVSLIEKVAEKTKLLALNASIEASRAGKSGRGFAVVAEQVRVLSQQTASETHSIQRLVLSLQATSGELKTHVLDGLEKVSENVELVRNNKDNMLTLSEGLSILIGQNVVLSEELVLQSRKMSSLYTALSQLDGSVERITERSQSNIELSTRLLNVLQQSQATFSFKTKLDID